MSDRENGSVETERRSYPRFSVEHSVELVDAAGGVFPTLTLDISLTGVQLLCDGPTAKRISPGGEIPPGRPIKVQVRMRLQDKRSAEPIRVQVDCNVISLRQVEEDEYRVGLKFIDFHGRSYDQLETYIDQRAEVSE